MLWFMAGVAATLIVTFTLFNSPEARADAYSCIRTDLNARGMSGNIPDPQFTITYDVPPCYAAAGYRVEKVYMHGSQVAVRYVKN